MPPVAIPRHDAQSVLNEVSPPIYIQAKTLITRPAFVRACFRTVTAHTQLLPSLTSLTVQQVAAVLRGTAGRLTFVDQIFTVQQAVVPAKGSGEREAMRGSSGNRVFEFACRQTKMLYMAKPPLGLSTSWLLAQVLSRELGSPVTLPLHPFIEAGVMDCLADGLEAAVLPGGHNPDLELVLQAGQFGVPLLHSDEQMVSLKPLRRCGKYTRSVSL